MNTQRDPSPEEIRLACLEIQRGWTATERLRRLRSDLRPNVILCDGRRQDIDADDFEAHIATNAAYRRTRDEAHKAAETLIEA